MNPDDQSIFHLKQKFAEIKRSIHDIESRQRQLSSSSYRYNTSSPNLKSQRDSSPTLQPKLSYEELKQRRTTGYSEQERDRPARNTFSSARNYSTEIQRSGEQDKKYYSGLASGMEIDSNRLKTENDDLTRENNQLIKEINYIRNSNKLQVAQITKMTEEIQQMKRRQEPSEYMRKLQANDIFDSPNTRYHY